MGRPMNKNQDRRIQRTIYLALWLDDLIQKKAEKEKKVYSEIIRDIVIHAITQEPEGPSKGEILNEQTI